ncbi:MAG TPA: bifunctional demethylmenaquinone methyltransferase/2-methoxy-6-polyprenyl-1,4-benzoquinol methylase UbiE [Rhodospirillaceae bacterium]|nr:bifunctional demethylmenaquinone methyltransferase/2-methoxy-6-polyprenyl-1,4-benzoquinol methylase UbiE [Rhodospirillaceae bacterium]
MQFGQQTVAAPMEKTRRVRGVFESVAAKYDLMNDVMSLGWHRLWKRIFVGMVSPQNGMDILDLAGGTGDITKLMHRPAPRANYTVCDLTPEMMAVGKKRLLNAGIANVNWIAGDAAQLPFKNNSFDRVVISFGLRNVTYLDRALAEIRRVLKPGGKFYCLEFTTLPHAGAQKIYETYNRVLIPQLGGMIAGNRASYDYLIESINRFPDALTLTDMMREAGFHAPQYRYLTGGIVAVHEGIKPN